MYFRQQCLYTNPIIFLHIGTNYFTSVFSLENIIVDIFEAKDKSHQQEINYQLSNDYLNIIVRFPPQIEDYLNKRRNIVR